MGRVLKQRRRREASVRKAAEAYRKREEKRRTFEWLERQNSRQTWLDRLLSAAGVKR